MNILLLFSHRWRAGRAGGAETHVSDLIRDLSRRGHEIVIATDAVESGSPSKTSDVVAHYELPFKTINPFATIRVYRSLEEIVAQHRTEIIHAHHRTAGYYAEHIYRNLQVPYVVTVHDPWRSTPLKQLHGTIFRRLIAVSDFIKQVLVLQFHIPPERVKTIYNGVDPVRFEKVDPESARQFRKTYGVKQGEVVLSLIGRVSKAKGHYDLVRALKLLPKSLNYRSLIIGEGKERKNLERMIRAEALGEKLTFCGYQSNIPVAMAASDVVLLPSYREPFGLTIVQAMLSHKPVIASNAGGIPEIITHGTDGILFPAGDVPALAANIARLVSDQELRFRLGEEGYKTAVKRFLLARMIDETERHYSEIIQATKGAGKGSFVAPVNWA